MDITTIIKFISSTLKIVAMGIFVFPAYKGTFSAGNSTTVFIGVAVLAVVIVVTHTVDEIRRDKKTSNTGRTEHEIYQEKRVYFAPAQERE